MVIKALVVAALLSAAAAHAVDFERRALVPRAGSPVGSQCVPFYIGQQPSGGNVCATISGGQITITYPTFSDARTYSNVHLWLGCNAPTGSNPGTSPGQYPYTTGTGGACTVAAGGKSASCTIPLPSCVGCDKPLYIISHGDTSAGTGQGFVSGQCISSTCNPWFTYWSITPACQCVVTNTFPPVSTSVSDSDPEFVQDTANIVLQSLVGASTNVASTSTSCDVATVSSLGSLHMLRALRLTMYVRMLCHMRHLRCRLTSSQ
jgi:hypothetical protein